MDRDTKIEVIEKVIYSHLECVICAEYFADMMQCYNGHSHCKSCLQKYELHSRPKKEVKCSVCCSKKGWSTNRQMFSLITSMNFKLKCNVDGCPLMIDAIDLENHRRV